MFKFLMVSLLSHIEQVFINYPAASSGVLEQRQLIISMQLLILISLIFYISAYHLFITMLSNGTCKISIRPKLASPQLLLYMRTASEYLSGCNAFYQGHYLCHTIGRYRLNQKMDMIPIGTYLQKLQLISLLYLQTHTFQNIIHFLINHRSPVFGGKNQVVHQHRNIMTFV